MKITKKIILNKENSLNKKVNIPNIKRHSSGLIRRNKNYQLPESKSGKISPNRIVINNQKQIGTKILKTTRNSPKERNEIKLLANKTKKIPINQKNNNNNINNINQNLNNNQNQPSTTINQTNNTCFNMDYFKENMQKQKKNVESTYNFSNKKVDPFSSLLSFGK